MVPIIFTYEELKYDVGWNNEKVKPENLVKILKVFRNKLCLQTKHPQHTILVRLSIWKPPVTVVVVCKKKTAKTFD